MKPKFLLKSVSILALVGGLGFGALNHQQIYDWTRLRNFQPEAGIAALAKDIDFTPKGKNIFYVSHPELNTLEEFKLNCTDAEQTIVLGCYKDEQDIFIRDITDKRLSGIEQVTAAHEMLHAAYARLSGAEKERIDELVADAYSKVTDKRIKETVQIYEKKDKNVVPNELHSIIGTEVSKLPKELEDYYAQYFKNRQAVVNFSKKYESVFTARKSEIAKDDAKLASTKKEIDALRNNLDSDLANIQSEKSRLSSLRSSGNISAYNSGVASYNDLVNAYNADINLLQTLISEYNALVKERNLVASDLGTLINSIDSRAPSSISN